MKPTRAMVKSLNSGNRTYRRTFWIWFAITLTVTVTGYGGNRALPELILAAALLVMSVLWLVRVVRTGGPVALGPRTPHVIAAGWLLWTAAFLIPLDADTAARLSAWSAWGQETNREVARGTDVAVPVPAATASIDPAASAHALRKLGGYYLWFVLLTAHVSRWRDVRTLLTLVVGVAVIEALVGSAGVLTGSSRFLWLLPNPVDEGHRHFGTFVNPNHAGTLLGVGLMLWLPLAFLPFAMGSRRAANVGSLGSGVRFPVLGLAGAVLAVGLLLTGSHGALAATALPLLVCLIRLAIRHPRARLPLLLVGLLTVTVGIAAARVLPEAERAHQVNKILDRQAWLAGERPLVRRTIWQGAFAAAAVAPWCGSGPGTFIDAYRPFDATRKETIINSAHNTYLDLLVERGLVGVGLAVLSAGWLGCMLRRASRRIRHRTRPDANPTGPSCARRMLGMGLGGAVAVCLLHGVVDFPLRIPAIVLVFGAVAVAVGRCARGRQPEPGHGRRRVLIPLATVVAASVLVVWSVPPLLATVFLARTVSVQRETQRRVDTLTASSEDRASRLREHASALHGVRFHDARGAAYGLKVRTQALHGAGADPALSEALLRDAMEMLGTHPFCVEARVAAATAAAHRGDARAALILSRQAQRHDRGHADTHFAVGRALWAIGADGPALIAFADSLNTSPRFVYAVARLVRERRREGEMLSLRIDDPRSLCWLAMRLPRTDARIKQHVAARLDVMLRNDEPGLPRAQRLYLEGQSALWLEDKPEEAIESFKQSLIIEPLVWIRWHLAQAYRRTGRSADAEAQMNIIAKVEPNYTPPEESGAPSATLESGPAP